MPSLPLEILFFPFPSPGHYLPLLDIAALVASHGAKATVVVNPSILSRLSPSVLRTSNLRFHSLPFPSAAAGLPDEISTADAVPANLSHRFAVAISLLREPFIELLRRLSPSAVISDSLLPFTVETAASLNIPWFSFPGTGLFALSIDFSLSMNRPQFTSDSFGVPGLPDRIELARSQLKETTLPGKLTSEFFALAKKAEDFSSGIVVNSFAELEPGYAEHYQKETGKRVFLVGPVSVVRFGEEEEEKDGPILNWLKKKKERSVLYVCFGSLCHLPKNQILEIGRGLEDSGVAFIWVIREGPASASPEVDLIEKRIGDRGMIVRGWIAGQASLLRHSSIGGFLTHCGWGAVTEAAAAGVPMLTWPMFGEQFYNEKLVNEVVGIGVGIGTKEGFVWGEEEKIGVLVGRERISERVKLLMSYSDSDSSSCMEIEGLRKRVEKMKEKGRKAMEEGGASYKGVESLLEHCKGMMDG